MLLLLSGTGFSCLNVRNGTYARQSNGDSGHCVMCVIVIEFGNRCPAGTVGLITVHDFHFDLFAVGISIIKDFQAFVIQDLQAGVRNGPGLLARQAGAPAAGCLMGSIQRICLPFQRSVPLAANKDIGFFPISASTICYIEQCILARFGNGSVGIGWKFLISSAVSIYTISFYLIQNGSQSAVIACCFFRKGFYQSNIRRKAVISTDRKATGIVGEQSADIVQNIICLFLLCPGSPHINVERSAPHD